MHILFLQLSLLLKNDPLVTQLRLFDVRLAPGVAADIGHINTPAVTTGYSPDGPEGGLEKALEGAEIIVIPAGVPRKPGMTRDDLFNVRTRALLWNCSGFSSCVQSY